MSTSTRVIFITGILLLIYGYSCRLFNIYFFWDSKHFGWIMIATGLIGFLIDLKTILAAQGKNIFIIRVLIGIIIIAFGIAGGATILLKSSGAYQQAIENIKLNEQVKNEIGTVKGFGLFPSGWEFLNFAFGINPGPATFVITVRGSRAIIDMEITLYKYSPAEQTIVQ